MLKLRFYFTGRGLTCSKKIIQLMTYHSYTNHWLYSVQTKLSMRLRYECFRGASGFQLTADLYKLESSSNKNLQPNNQETDRSNNEIEGKYIMITNFFIECCCNILINHLGFIHKTCLNSLYVSQHFDARDLD